MIDFEATVKLIQKDRSGTHSCHPACSKCVGYAHRYVEAALGDEPLYVDASDCEPSFEGNHVWTFDSDCLECGQETRPVVQVWPKEGSDEPH